MDDTGKDDLKFSEVVFIFFGHLYLSFLGVIKN